MANFYLKATNIAGRSGRVYLPGTLNPETIRADFQVLFQPPVAADLPFGSQLLLNFNGALLVVNATLLSVANVQITLADFVPGATLVLSDSFVAENAKLVSTIIKNRHVLGVTINQLNVQAALSSSNFSASLDQRI